MLLKFRKAYARFLLKLRKKSNTFNLFKSWPKHVALDINGKNNLIELHDNVLLNHCQIIISGFNNSIKIFDYSKLNNCTIWIEGNNNSLIIGKNCTIHGNTELALCESTNLKIGDDCLISKNCQLRTSDMHSIIANDKRINIAKDIKIGKHNWICQNVIILKGVETKNNVVIGAGTILSKSISESDALVCGNPGKIAKTNITWKQERI